MTEQGATQTGVPAEKGVAQPQPTARELAMESIGDARLAQFEQEAGVKFDPVADPDADPEDAAAEATRKGLEAQAVKPAANLDAAAQVAAQGGDELIIDADTLAHAKVRVKVDGVEQLESASKVFAQYQKGVAAEVRLADSVRLQREAAADREAARQLRADAERTPRAEPQPVAKAAPAEKFKEATDALYNGESDKAATLFAEAMAAAVGTTGAVQAATQLDTHALAQEVKQQLSQESALDKLFSDYPEIKADADYALLADRYTNAHIALGKSAAEAIAMAGEQIGEKFKLGKHADPTGRPLQTSGKPTTREQKLEGKRGLDEPTASAARAAEPELREESAQDIIEQLRKSRPGATP